MTGAHFSQFVAIKSFIAHISCCLSFSVIWHLNLQFPQFPHVAISHGVNVSSLPAVSSSFSGPKTRRYSKINAINFFSKLRMPGRVSLTYWSNVFDTFWKRGVQVGWLALLVGDLCSYLTLQLGLLYSSGLGSLEYELFPTSFLLFSFLTVLTLF